MLPSLSRFYYLTCLPQGEHINNWLLFSTYGKVVGKGYRPGYVDLAISQSRGGFEYIFIQVRLR